MKKNYVSPELFCDEYVADTMIASSACDSAINGQLCDSGYTQCTNGVTAGGSGLVGDYYCMGTGLPF